MMACRKDPSLPDPLLPDQRIQGKRIHSHRIRANSIQGNFIHSSLIHSNRIGSNRIRGKPIRGHPATHCRIAARRSQVPLRKASLPVMIHVVRRGPHSPPSPADLARARHSPGAVPLQRAHNRMSDYGALPFSAARPERCPPAALPPPELLADPSDGLGNLSNSVSMSTAGLSCVPIRRNETSVTM